MSDQQNSHPEQASGIAPVLLISVIAFAVILVILALVVFLGGSGESMMEYEGFN